jgi:hypothetical protein
MKLLDTVTTNTTGSTFEIVDNRQNRVTRIPTFSLSCYGTFGGATVKFQVSNDGTNWIDAYSFTAADAVIYEGSFRYGRGVVSSAGTTSVTLELI